MLRAYLVEVHSILLENGVNLHVNLGYHNYVSNRATRIIIIQHR